MSREEIMTKHSIAVIGGDKRTAYMAPLLAEEGYPVACFGTAYEFTDKKKIPAHAFSRAALDKIQNASSLMEAVDGAQTIICGMPFAQNNSLYHIKPEENLSLTELQRCLRKKQRVFGGMIPKRFRQHCEEREISCFDFMEDEELVLYNTIATAEGVILEALLHKDTNLHKSSVLVMGYGRCGRVLSDKLKGLSAHVTVCSQNPRELALADSLGLEILDLAELSIAVGAVSQFEYIFNTIPAQLFHREQLMQLRQDALLLDISSGQGCLAPEDAAALTGRFYRCQGLPGKYAGYSSACCLTKYVLTKMPSKALCREEIRSAALESSPRKGYGISR